MLNSIEILGYGITMLSKLSFENDLINNDKLTHLIFSSNKQKRLNEKSYLIRSAGKAIRQESPKKLLGEYFNQNLTWTEQGICCIKIQVQHSMHTKNF